MPQADFIPLHLAEFTFPTLSQEQSPLFSTIPGEIRDRILDFALCEYEDKSRLYGDATCYKRPSYFAPRRTSTALLRTCQQVFREAWSIPWTNAEHTFWLTEPERMPPNAQRLARLRAALRSIAENVQQSHGTVPNIDHVRIFAQMYVLEPGIELGKLFNTPHFLPFRVTLTLRHADWWFWEEDAVLRIDATWVKVCRLPSSVREFRLELESLERKKQQIDSIAEQMVQSWTFQRMDDVKMTAEPLKASSVMRWTGTSAWVKDDTLISWRWLRDEARPGQLDYYVASVVWKPRPSVDGHVEVEEAPNLRATSGTVIPWAEDQYVDMSSLEEAGIGMDVPADVVISRLNEWLA